MLEESSLLVVIDDSSPFSLDDFSEVALTSSLEVVTLVVSLETISELILVPSLILFRYYLTQFDNH